MPSNLERSKCEQACGILGEDDTDAWLIWVRETSQQSDPILPLILGGDVVWQSAFIFTSSGDRIAIVGNFDADGIKALGLYDTVIPYTKGIKDELLQVLEHINPEKIAINYSKNDVAADGLSVGMHLILQEYLSNTPYLTRLVSAENVIQKLRIRRGSQHRGVSHQMPGWFCQDL